MTIKDLNVLQLKDNMAYYLLFISSFSKLQSKNHFHFKTNVHQSKRLYLEGRINSVVLTVKFKLTSKLFKLRHVPLFHYKAFPFRPNIKKFVFIMENSDSWIGLFSCSILLNICFGSPFWLLFWGFGSAPLELSSLDLLLIEKKINKSNFQKKTLQPFYKRRTQLFFLLYFIETFFHRFWS